MRKILQKLIRDESGASMVEYALLIALISAALVAVLGTLKTDISAIFSNIGATLAAAA